MWVKGKSDAWNTRSRKEMLKGKEASSDIRDGQLHKIMKATSVLNISESPWNTIEVPRESKWILLKEGTFVNSAL